MAAKGPSTSAAAWKLAGISYAAYASICATLARRALKEPMRSAALKNRDAPKAIVEKWQSGRIVDSKPNNLPIDVTGL